MNRTKIKNYAPQARRDFIQAVKDRGAFYGLTEKRIEPITVKGDVAIIAGRAFPREVAGKRKTLHERIERDGYEPTMEALAYTWFNRLVAIRYMELHGYLDHGYRVLSNSDPAKAMPEILEHAEHVDLPDLNRDRVVDLKLDGTKEAELYRMLLVAQCNALHSAMPFLFERIGDETELVLPESLLHSDSIVRKLVSGINEEDWKEVEIIGWLYQFYILERKDDVIGKVVRSDDIPAATQFFTPNWIVKYLVQNSLGRLWLATYPPSPLKGQMKYYIEPADQTPEIREQLRAITPTSLDPEEIRFLDPACGSAHILVEAYNLLKAIYQERGYRAKDIPRLILGKNLFGLEIDDRAAQFAAFALMMKARADDRRIFDQGIRPHIRALVQADGMDAEDIAAVLNVPTSNGTPPPGMLFETEDNLFTRAASTATASPTVALSDIKALIDLFEHAKTFGSLIQVPQALAARLPQMEQKCQEVAQQTNDIASRTAMVFLPIIEQARMLAGRYDCVAANPPYMGSSFMESRLKEFAKRVFPNSRADLYAMFIERSLQMASSSGIASLVTMHSWMFVEAFEKLRQRLIDNHTLLVMAHLGIGAFSELNSKIVQSAMFSIQKSSLCGFIPRFQRLTDGSECQKDEALRRKDRFFDCVNQQDFEKLPGSPLAYWLPSQAVDAFANDKPLRLLGTPAQGSTIGDNEKFLRLWYELALGELDNWRECIKGGGYRKWYGNRGWLIRWHNDGQEVKEFDRATIRNTRLFGMSGVEWSRVTNIQNSFRPFSGTIFPESGAGFFYVSQDLVPQITAFLNSCVAHYLLKALNPTLNCQSGTVGCLPFRAVTCKDAAQELIQLSKADWDSAETSIDFDRHPLLSLRSPQRNVEGSYQVWSEACAQNRHRAKLLEEYINRLFIEAYQLEGELVPNVEDKWISLFAPERSSEFPHLISYAVGCVMGRYSLDKPGLIYSHGGNVGFDPGQYRTFPADPDGIVPIMEGDWFADDATNRFVEFLGVAWPREHLDENLKFVAESLGPSRGEEPRDTIRRYLATGFYKHHLQTYKRRPIYWLFSSGKQRAFQCLVYLHRYHEGTLSRMRTEYVIPLQGKLNSQIDQLAGDILKATSTSHRNTLTRERDKLVKQQAELRAFDEKLRHYADIRISLDLDDGVKVNYGKFGDLLAEVKAVTGGGEEE
jgi:hypothetical protein